MGDMDMAVTDTVDTVERDLPSHTMDMVDTEDTDMVDTEDTDMVDTDAHMLMEVSTILARDLLNHLPTMVMDTAVVMDMVVTDMVDTVERDPLSHTMVMVVTDTEDTDMVVTDTDMVVKPYQKLTASVI